MSYTTLSIILFALFTLFLFSGVPLAITLGLSGIIVVALGDMGLSSIPLNVYSSISKYPLLALPMFILAGVIFERAGIAESMVRFASSIVGPRRGALAATAIIVAMIMGGISGSGPAASSAVGAVMIPQMLKAAYPKGFAATVVAAGGSTDILIPPSIAFIVYSMLVPAASVPALFAAGLIPGILVGLALIAVSISLTHIHKIGTEKSLPRPPFWKSFKEAIWALLAPIIILGGMRTGMVTPTEAAVVAVFYGLIVGIIVYKSITWRVIYDMLVESCEVSATIFAILALASVFALASNSLGSFESIANGLISNVASETTILLIVNAILIVAGMFIDGISIFFVFLPLFIPVMQHFGWDPVWFGIIMTMTISIGQVHPPVGVNLLVTCRFAKTSMESTTYWSLWVVAVMIAVLLLCTFVPEIALWLPHTLGYR
jgi:C4-dicarboxylate transporter DctM subunit